jgi:hypothetical protein
MNWLIARLHERSTWLAIFTFAGLFGIKLEPELRESIINAIIAVAAVLAFVYKDKPDEVDKPPIELQSRLGRGQAVPDDPVDVGPHDSRASTDRVGQPERVSTPLQSPVEPQSRRDSATSGWNDQ